MTQSFLCLKGRIAKTRRRRALIRIPSSEVQPALIMMVVVRDDRFRVETIVGLSYCTFLVSLIILDGVDQSFKRDLASDTYRTI